MLFDIKLRAVKDRLMKTLTGRWAENINPDIITLAAFTAGIACASAALTGSLKAALLLWILNRILDGLDGAVARRYKKQSDEGAYLDIMTDFTVYAAIPLALAWQYNSVLLWKATAFLLGTFYINAVSWMYLSALLEKKKKQSDNRLFTSVEMPSGIVEGTETIIFYSLFFILPAYLVWIFSIMAILTFITVIQRLFFALRNFSE